MDIFLHQVFSGLATGGIYACLGLALVMIYRSTHHVNFAQGEMAMFSTYIALFFLDRGLGYWTAFLLTACISFAAGAAIERVLVRPVQRGSPLTAVIVFIALLVIFNSTAGWLFSPELREFPSPFKRLGGLGYLSAHETGMLLVVFLELAAVFAFFRYTRAGLGMRAVAQNPLSSSLVGIHVGRMLALGWGIAAVIGAVAGMMVAPIVYLDPNMMAGILIYGFASALLGGIENPWGAVAGGFILGVLDNLAGAYLIGNELKFTFALFIIVCVLLFRPAGLFGRKTMARV